MAADVAMAAAAAQAPDYEAAELYTRAFRVGALGLGWRRLLGPPDLSLAEEEAEEADAAVAAALGCAPSTAAELRAVCRWAVSRPGFRLRCGGDAGGLARCWSGGGCCCCRLTPRRFLKRGGRCLCTRLFLFPE